MAYHALGKFKCDGCKVIESSEIDLPADNLRPMPPKHWLRVETTQLRSDLEVIAVKHFCPSCAKLVENYLRGAPTAEQGVDRDVPTC
jgi:hypothetical protein